MKLVNVLDVSFHSYVCFSIFLSLYFLCVALLRQVYFYFSRFHLLYTSGEIKCMLFLLLCHLKSLLSKLEKSAYNF